MPQICEIFKYYGFDVLPETHCYPHKEFLIRGRGIFLLLEGLLFLKLRRYNPVAFGLILMFLHSFTHLKLWNVEES